MNTVETQIKYDLLETIERLERMITAAKCDIESDIFHNIVDDAFDIKQKAEILVTLAEDFTEAGD